ncbi:IclR family transcriptional regulator [Luteococcus sp. OSA5]|uniref:IclR family transcriptional regulator n=1 Tax=Luteococcus sp. OSA5 TaxID=3401630 RepID=UPI003B438381
MVQILRTFDQQHRRQTLTQVCRRSGIPLATCHRMLREMSRLGLVAQQQDGQFTIGHLVWELGMLSPVQRGLRQVAAPFMQDLLAATRQIVNLFVLDTDRALLVERISGSAVGDPFAVPGDRLPLHTSAAGKIFLAHGALGEDPLRVLALTPETRRSIAHPSRLQEELDLVGQRGWATTAEEQVDGAWGLAVPVFGFNGEVLAALGIVTVSPLEDPNRVVPALKVTSAAISRAMVGQQMREN